MINCDEENTYRVIPYEQGLMFPLRLYHIVCWRFAIEKNKSFAEQLMEIVEETLESCQTEDEINTLTHSYQIAWVTYINGKLKDSLIEAFHDTKGYTDREEAWEHIYNVIQTQREKLLIVIDNVETIEQDSDIERLGDLPCRILVTSRTEKIGGLYRYSVDHLPEEDCRDIFYHYYVTNVFYPSVVAIPNGIVMMLLLAKVPKKGVFTICAAIQAILFLLVGAFWFIPIGLIIGGVICDFLVMSRNEITMKSMMAAYALFSAIFAFSAICPIKFLQSAFVGAMEKNNIAPEYIQGMLNITSVPMLVVIVAAGLVGGLIGGSIGQKALKKHFIKAGLVSVK